ncbi:hypothetical protein H5410_005519 [Solanum commersonii]|uniref:Uncharacterized protein n=1 Tax=Solanum commersonii TaxID=4109 RepID=A0A9J6A6U3_SOLCO|nr:hypothetical protein H5410_005519 [Solanum commersonii]
MLKHIHILVGSGYRLRGKHGEVPHFYNKVLQEVVEDEMSSIDCQNNPADNYHLFEEVIIHPKITSDNISPIFVT